MLSIEQGNLVAIATLVGFVGDILLQLMTHYGMGGPSGWGLNEYFLQHGRVESTFIAGGMLGLFFILYSFTNLPLTLLSMLIYGVLLDLVFRVFKIFPSLDGYYKNLNYFWSAFWGAIPMMIPIVIYKLLTRSKLM
jgi:hypothetical protein